MTLEVVAKYSEKFKEKMVRRLVGPNAVSANRLAVEVGIPQGTLSRWLLRRPARLPAMTKANEEDQPEGTAPEPRRPQDWPPAERLAVVLEARNVAEAELGAFLRRKGLHEADLSEWRRVALEGAETALAGQATGKRTPAPDGKRVRDLEREVKELHEDLRRKEKALAEVTALLVLKKKVDLLMRRDADGDEPGRSGK